MEFVKMQGIGNDFILTDGFRGAEPDDLPALARRMCDRHFGVGADGLIRVAPSDCADARMRIFNADGSEAEMCGNGLRCAAKFLKDQRLVEKDEMTVETRAGILTVTFGARGLTVDMGAPCLDPKHIPVDALSNQVIIRLGEQPCQFFCVSMGNPHAVTFDRYPEDDSFRALGAMLEKHPLFPARVNVEFCRVRDGIIDVRVWERGSGETLACGTGSCAALTAAASLGLTGREADVRLPGGILHIRWAEDGRLFMTGPAETVYAGVYPA